MKHLIIYHANCADGFTAAWAATQALGAEQTELHPATHGTAPPEVTGRTVSILDFCYPRDTLLQMADVAASITVVDHHKTAQEALSTVSHPRLRVHFDMSHSGARLAWDHFHGETRPRPPLVDYVEDKDLWRWALANTREIMAYVSSFEQTLENWDAIDTRLRTNPETVITVGETLTRQFERDLNTIEETCTRELLIAGHRIPAANANSMFASDLGNRLIKQGVPFAAIYFDDARGMRNFSLRSCDAGLDVSAIATQFGGGGHRNAAGFSVPIKQAQTFEIEPRTAPKQ